MRIFEDQEITKSLRDVIRYLSGVRAADSLDGVKEEQESNVAESRVTISAYLAINNFSILRASYTNAHLSSWK